MKIQIDTTTKTIKIEEAVKLGELFEKLQALFPDASWKDWNLEIAVINNWINPVPVIIKEYIPAPMPITLPWWTTQPYIGDYTPNNPYPFPTVIYSTGVNLSQSTDGAYNLEIK